MLKRAVLILGSIVLVLLAVIATRPDSYRVERSAQMPVPADITFGLVNDFHQWQRWSPWEGLDPALQRTFSGAPSGTGAIYSWIGNDKVGEGRMTIEDSRPAEQISIKLEFIKPFQSTCTTTFKFSPTGDGTQVLWAMEGRNNFMMKAFSLFMNMEHQIGGDFDRGLAHMKEAAVKDAKVQADARRQAAAAQAAPAPTAAVQAPALPAAK